MQITPVENCSIVLPVDERATMYVVYELQAVLVQGEPPETIFVGSSPMRDVYTLRDAKKNSEFMRIFRNGGSVLIRIVAWSTDPVVMRRCAMEHIKKLGKRPICNERGRRVSKSRPVRHIGSGTEFKTQIEAADHFGIHASALSRHLNGSLNHVSGHEFEYVVV